MVSPWSLFSGQWCRSSDFPGTLSCLPGRLIAGKPGAGCHRPFLCSYHPNCNGTRAAPTALGPLPLQQVWFSGKSLASRAGAPGKSRLSFPSWLFTARVRSCSLGSPGRERVFGTNPALPRPPAPTGRTGRAPRSLSENHSGMFPFPTVSGPLQHADTRVRWKSCHAGRACLSAEADCRGG